MHIHRYRETGLLEEEMLLVSQLKCVLHNNIFLQCLLTVGFNYTVIKDGETAVNGSLLVQMILVH